MKFQFIRIQEYLVIVSLTVSQFKYIFLIAQITVNIRWNKPPTNNI